ncbi:MAG: helix-turn-helix domain-containing protein [Actinobacteria bacterium]|nr:helix-turn-helix domain-containing protein [Actinomycetota bacterium]
MERDLEWYRELSAEDRSWVSLVAQAGISAFLAWFRSGDPTPVVASDIFGTAPRELAQKITLRQTLDLVRTTVDTVEEHVGLLAADGNEAALREAVLRYSREVAFTTAQIYASAAESRGAWDARLESLVVHAVVRGEADETLRSRAAELGWSDVTQVAVITGAARHAAGSSEVTGVVLPLRHAARQLGLDALTAVQGQRLICVLGRTADPVADAAKLVAHFGPGPIVVGPQVPHLYAAGRSARAALSGLDAVRAWPQAPRPVAADDLLAERALLGEAPARRALVDRVYRQLRDRGSALLETATAFLDGGGGLEATGRLLFVHPNTVRYRLRRIEETVHLDLTDPRDAWVARVALALGRVGDQPQSGWRQAVSGGATR